jgi:AraC-like DNA-binding protein
VTAIRFMQRSLARPLTTREIAAAADTSERSLRRLLRRFTGQSPVAFHRHLRLEAARHALCDNHANADITTAAGMHGFSHFTDQYRRRYGELPSATLRATRESSLPLPSHAICDPISLIVHPFKSMDLESSNAAFAETRAFSRPRTARLMSAASSFVSAEIVMPRFDPDARRMSRRSM